MTLHSIFPNPRQDLFPGMHVRTISTEGLANQVISLPQRTLVHDSHGNPTVWVVTSQNSAELHAISVSRSCRDTRVVTGRLRPGEKVIAAGLQ